MDGKKLSPYFSYRIYWFLDLINGHILFISLAFLIRIVEAMGNAAFLTAGFAIIAHEFADNIASTFASLEAFFGLGLIAGPTMGGVLYQLGGFPAPFVTLGLFLFTCALFTRITLPDLDNYQSAGPNTDKVWGIFRIKGMAVCTSTIVTTTISISFISATLEPHIRQFDLTAIQIGLVFIVNGAVYGATAPFWGWFCDSKRLRPKAISILGGLMLVVGACFLGPAPFIPLRASLIYVILGLVLHGLSIGARLVSSFTDALQIAVNAGMPNSIETYGVISALWTSSVAFGSFIGPTLSGFLYDHYGFANASLFIIILIAIMVLVEFWSLVDTRRTKTSSDYEDLDRQEATSTTNLDAIKNTSTYIDPYTVGISSNRVLNLVYSSNSDLRDEMTTLLENKNRLITTPA